MHVHGNMDVCFFGLTYYPIQKKKCKDNTPSALLGVIHHLNLCATPSGIAVYFGAKNTIEAKL